MTVITELGMNIRSIMTVTPFVFAGYAVEINLSTIHHMAIYSAEKAKDAIPIEDEHADTQSNYITLSESSTCRFITAFSCQKKFNCDTFGDKKRTQKTVRKEKNVRVFSVYLHRVMRRLTKHYRKGLFLLFFKEYRDRD